MFGRGGRGGRANRLIPTRQYAETHHGYYNPINPLRVFDAQTFRPLCGRGLSGGVVSNAYGIMRDPFTRRADCNRDGPPLFAAANG